MNTRLLEFLDYLINDPVQNPGPLLLATDEVRTKGDMRGARLQESGIDKKIQW